MADMNSMLDTMKTRTEEVFKCYADKQNWDEKDLKCAKEAAELYDKLQTIQMNTGIWEGIKEDGGYSGARYPRISYGNDMSMRRGRGADGRYVSRGDMYDGGYEYGDEMPMRGDGYGRMSNNRGGSYGGSYGGHYDDGRSMHSVKDQAIQRLENLMDSASSDYERQEIRKMIETIEKQER